MLSQRILKMAGGSLSDMRCYAVFGGVFVLVLLQVHAFMQGYRLTADDALFFEFFRQGWGAAWQAAHEWAVYTGRIGHYLMTPLNTLGSYLAGNSVSRTLMVTGYFALMALCCLYAVRLFIGRSLAAVAWLFLALLACHALLYEHMPPTSYPLQNTLPALIIVSIRLWLWQQPELPRAGQVLLYAVMAAAIMVSEFMFLLATALMAVEHLRYLIIPNLVAGQRILGIHVRPWPLVADLLLVLGVLSVYFSFRLTFPSQYGGNTPDGMVDISRFLQTAFYHAVAGSLFYRLPRLDPDVIRQAFWGIPLLVGVVTAISSAYLTQRLPQLSVKRWALMGGIGLILMLYVTLPIAATSRAQQWCLENGDCGYLDSRMAFWFMGWLMLSVVGVCISINCRYWFRQLIHWALALALGISAAVNHAANQVISSDMQQTSAAWQQAQQLACSFSNASSSLSELAAQIDPESRVSMHPDMNRKIYWRDYMHHLRENGHCEF